MRVFVHKLIAGTIIGLLIVGCGGSSGGTKQRSISSVHGVVEDGPIKNARVFIDLNFNGEYDEGEPYDITNESGEYTIEYLFGSGQKYMIIAKGEEGSKDVERKTDVRNFVLFNILETPKSGSDVLIGKNFSLSLTPHSFQNLLKNLDKELKGKIKEEVGESILDERNMTKLFDKTKNKPIHDLTTKVAKVVQFQTEKDTLESVVTDLGLSKKSIVILDKNKSQYSLILGSLTTIPAQHGEMIVAKMLEPTEENFSITKYDNSLEVPDIDQIIDANYTFVTGYEIRGEEVAKEKIEKQLDFSDIKESNLSLVYHSEYGWDLKDSVDDVNLSDFHLKEVKPFLLIKKAKFFKKSIQLPEISLLENPTIIVKAKDKKGREIVVDVIDVNDKNSTVTIKESDEYNITNIVIVDKDIGSLFQDRKPLLVKDVKEQKDKLVVVSKDRLTILTDDELKKILLNGSLLEKCYGIKNLIDTKILYEKMNLSYPADSNESLKGLIDQCKNGQDVSAVTIKKVEDGIQMVSKWDFKCREGLIKRDIEKRYINEENKGSLEHSTYSFKLLDKNIRVTFDDSEDYQEELPNYTQQSKAHWLGTALLKKGEVVSAKFIQEHLLFNSASGKSTVDGILEAKDNNFSFRGDFTMQTESNGTINGKVNILEATFQASQKSERYINENKIRTALISIYEPYKQPSELNETLLGEWSGEFNDSCSDQKGQIELMVNENSMSWWGEIGKDFYGTEVSIDHDRLIFKDKDFVWGTASYTQDSINGEWRSRGCRGEFNLTKR